MAPSFERRSQGGSSTSDNRWLERTTPSAPLRRLRRLFLSGRSHPSFAFLRQGGEFHSDASRHLLKSRLILNSLRSGGLTLRYCGFKDRVAGADAGDDNASAIVAQLVAAPEIH